MHNWPSNITASLRRTASWNKKTVAKTILNCSSESWPKLHSVGGLIHKSPPGLSIKTKLRSWYHPPGDETSSGARKSSGE
eukprot:3877388-Pyramimonas_sp.AAC.1